MWYLRVNRETNGPFFIWPFLILFLNFFLICPLSYCFSFSTLYCACFFLKYWLELGIKWGIKFALWLIRSRPNIWTILFISQLRKKAKFGHTFINIRLLSYTCKIRWPKLATYKNSLSVRHSVHFNESDKWCAANALLRQFKCKDEIICCPPQKASVADLIFCKNHSVQCLCSVKIFIESTTYPFKVKMTIFRIFSVEIERQIHKNAFASKLKTSS